MKYLIFLLIIERRCPLSLTEHCDYKYQLEDMIGSYMELNMNAYNNIYYVKVTHSQGHTTKCIQ